MKNGKIGRENFLSPKRGKDVFSLIAIFKKCFATLSRSVSKDR